MFVKFKTDGSRSEQGFSATIMYELSCGCNAAGSTYPECNSNGTCTCKSNVSGDKCTSCNIDTYGGFPNCFGNLI